MIKFSAQNITFGIMTFYKSIAENEKIILFRNPKPTTRAGGTGGVSQIQC